MKVQKYQIEVETDYGNETKRFTKTVMMSENQFLALSGEILMFLTKEKVEDYIAPKN